MAAAGRAPEGHTGDTDMRSVRRALAALDALLTAAPRAVRVADLARHLGVSAATASRLLATLSDEGYAARTVDRRYVIGTRALPMATTWLGAVREAAKGPARRVADQTGEIVVVSQMLGSEQVPLLWHLPPDRRGSDVQAVLAQVTSPYPLWATASGRAILGSLPPAQRGRLLPDEQVPSLTGSTPATAADIKSVIRGGVRAGLHIEQGQVRFGMRCYSVALEPTRADERLALAVICLDELSGTQERRIHRVLRREAFTTAVGLDALG
ncbi:MAG: helix-turn-helix domain-containing protein [Pseudonocardia sp.]|nr:helix-turn-helix domain-containing protein [Pseudonocardia sp.]